MYRCDNCDAQVQARQPQIKIVTDENKRPRTYPNGSVGWEIIRELNVCPKCAKELNNG